jgi:mono/diheme cytochrome c family protein
LPNHDTRAFGALGALLLIACGQQSDPQAPHLPALDSPSQPDAGNVGPVWNPPPSLTPFPPGDVLDTGPGSNIGAPPVLSTFPPTAFSPVRQAQRPLPAISGGTLAATASGAVVASDPDRDRIYVIDVGQERVDTLELAEGEEPGRVATHGERAFVALRGAGALLTVDLQQRRASSRLPICAAPRGVSFDAVESRVLVACAGGDLLAISEDGARVLARTHVAPDLRDVGRDAQGVWVSQYRSAKLLRLDAALKLAEQQKPADAVLVVPAEGAGFGALAVTSKQFTPTLAWRTVAGPGGEPFMLHQRAQSSMVGSEATLVGAYGATGPNGTDTGFCEGGIVHATISRFGSSQIALQRALPQAVVPVDLSVAPSGRRVAAVAPGNFRRQQLPGARDFVPQQLYLMKAVELTRAADFGAQLDPKLDCMGAGQGQQFVFGSETTAVQFLDDDTLLVQMRSPAKLAVLRFEEGDSPRLLKVITLSALEVRDTGHEVFHQNTGTGIACASCHGEALDDGHVWTFAKVGARRTQHLRGGVLQTAPFHWSGDLHSLGALISDVYVTRMGGAPLDAAMEGALSHWLGSLPQIPVEPGDAARVAGGRALFESAQVGCATCHAGESLRSDGLFDVGTGGSFEVPSLRGLSLRLPLMHSGCADTLEKRFDPSCGGGNHGATSQLSEEQLGDLIAYLASL